MWTNMTEKCIFGPSPIGHLQFCKPNLWYSTAQSITWRIWNFKNPSTGTWDMTRVHIYGHHCISDFWSTCWRLTTIKCADLNRYTFSSMFSHEKVTLFKSEHFIGNLLYCNLKVKVLRDLVMFASAHFKVWSENIIYYCYITDNSTMFIIF